MHIHTYTSQNSPDELLHFVREAIENSYYPAYHREAMAMFLQYHSAQAIASDAACGRIWCARIDGRLVGTVTMANGELGRMFVAAGLRSKGIGSLLVKEALSYARLTGLKSVTAWAVPFAREFYRRFGFEMVNADTLDFNNTREVPVPYIEMAYRPDEPLVSVCQAGEGDIDEMLAGQRLAFEEQCLLYGDWIIPPMTESAADVKRGMQGGALVLKAVENGRIIGAVRGQIEGDSTNIGRLYVLPQGQGRGIGRRLMAGIEERLSGALVYSLFTGERSDKNLGLYFRQGYALTGKSAPALMEGTANNYRLVWLEKPNPWPEIQQCIGRYGPR